MSVQLPFGLTPSEYAVIKKAYEKGCFISGPSASEKPSVPQSKDLAAEMGLSPQAYSNLLSNARRKLITVIGREIFEENGRLYISARVEKRGVEALDAR